MENKKQNNFFIGLKLNRKYFKLLTIKKCLPKNLVYYINQKFKNKIMEKFNDSQEKNKLHW